MVNNFTWRPKFMNSVCLTLTECRHIRDDCDRGRNCPRKKSESYRATTQATKSDVEVHDFLFAIVLKVPNKVDFDLFIRFKSVRLEKNIAISVAAL